MSKREYRTTKEQEQVITTVDTDAVDALMFDSVRDARKVAKLCETAEGEGCTQDAFTAFFTHEPKTLEESDPVQKGIVDTMLGMEEFKNLRAGTKNDEMSSALAAMQFAPELIKQVMEMRKKMEEAQKKAQEQGKPGPQKLGDALSEKDKAGLRQALRKGLGEAQQKTDDFNEQMSSWGVNKGELSRVPFEKRFELAEQMGKSQKLKKISEMVGRFKNVALSAAAKTPCHGVDEIVDITIGNDISKLLPSELVKLSETPELFYRDFAEKKLLNYEMKSIQDVGRGPIIACLDISGSMMEDGKEEWAKAVILALMSLAEKQKRSFGFIPFNDQVVGRKFWPKEGGISLQDKISVAETVSCGGTNFYLPLMASFEFRKKEPSLRPADIVFITDGVCDLYDKQLKEVLEMKKESDVRIYSMMMLLGGGHSYGYDHGRTLQKFSDQVNVINNLGDIDSIKDLMAVAAQNQGGPKKP